MVGEAAVLREELEVMDKEFALLKNNQSPPALDAIADEIRRQVRMAHEANFNVYHQMELILLLQSLAAFQMKEICDVQKDIPFELKKRDAIRLADLLARHRGLYGGILLSNQWYKAIMEEMKAFLLR